MMIAQAAREDWGVVVAALTKTLGDLQLAEDVLQDSLLKAMELWPTEGIPSRPAAWLYTTAKRKAIDQLRRSSNFRKKQQDILATLVENQSSDGDSTDDIPDERLRLVFTCCHPSLSNEAQVALTLKTLAGFSTEIIAKAFLVSETTMAQRIVRAKKKIREAGIPYSIPSKSDWSDRLAAVLGVVYFIFNESYSQTGSSDASAEGLSTEAMRLGSILLRLIPNEPEIKGLCALMLLHEARKPARCDANGCSVTLEKQDRRLWCQSKIREGDALLRDALVMGQVGPYQIQAAISAIHATSQSFASTDWLQIQMLYDRLYEMQPTPVIELNRIVAMSFAQSPAVALAELQSMEASSLETYQPFQAVKADLLRRTGDLVGARLAYDCAIDLSRNQSEIQFLKAMRLSIAT
ncbi:MAG: RNA polymerase sigma factor [Pseudobacteriovorax sp.]|nr:RNA polymerase sigma factor [Pseudobacteriovorax sp.]